MIGIEPFLKQIIEVDAACRLWHPPLALPNNIHPRLVLADWLEEHGEVGSAELIRVRAERDTMPLCTRFDAREVFKCQHKRRPAVCKRREELNGAIARLEQHGTRTVREMVNDYVCNYYRSEYYL